MNQSRRDFLKKSGCALGMVTLATQFEHFGMMSALAQKAVDNEDLGGENYKALIVVFLSGGNDGNNTLIPNHSSTTISNYAAYSAARSTQGLALAQNTLLPITVPRMGGLDYGLHPAFGTITGGVNNGLHELWAQQKMAIVPNLGTLVRPTTKTQYQTPSHPKPYQLYSHSDQVEQAQAGFAGTQSFTGWGGRIA
ncbi:MAG TPA: twin-arginine translocation signal domain-containing protein, partial [Pyrinomonadaceae bacterium]|nr:twin-arginine translocation signal domain-containing protein [Pyrinomonadaceae bacterium]